MDCVDIVGTGGDGAHTVNISSMASVVDRGGGRARGQARQPGGVVVLRRRPTCWRPSASSSTCRRAAVARCVAEAGIGFFFAPVFHPGFRFTGAPRREMGIGTVFNFLGPLANPARPVAAAIGCADTRMAPVLAAVLAGAARARWCSAATTAWTS